jgi:hypothetical protein
MMGQTGCAVLFMLPFAGVGVFTAVFSVRAALAHDWKQALFLAVFALTFGTVGFGGIVAVFAGKRRSDAQQAIRDAHADSPWLWRPDWAAGRVEDDSRTTASFAWFFAILWNLVSLPAGFFGVREAVEKGNHAALLALLFPAIGVGLLVWAVRSWLRYRRYGISRFELTTLPGVIGHSLGGTVRIAEPLRPEGGFQVTLTCLRRHTTGSGKNRSTSESILWQEDRRVMGVGTSIPLTFAIPADALPSDDSNPNDRRIWRLGVSADVPGVDYHSSFEVPVFRTEASDTPRTSAEEQAARDPEAPAVYRQPATSRIEVTSNRRGTEILYPAARNPAAAAGLTVFFAIWCAAIWATIRFGAPIIFPIVFGLFGILLLIGLLDAWLRVTRVAVEPGRVTVATGYLSAGTGKTISSEEIEDIVPRITMQAGATPYYDVTIVRKDGKKVSAGSSVRDKREAEWLAATMKESLRR